nr:PREDICTED: LOW QUALITY PROTEIN: uncharacterized protein C12orf79 homolog [Equus przewalskii]
MWLLPPATPVFLAGCHKERGKFGTHRGKPVGSVRPLLMVKRLERRIPANSFVISFFPSVIYPVDRQTIHLESSDKQRAMQFIVRG